MAHDPTSPSVFSLAERVLAGDRRAVARALTLVETDDELATSIVDHLYPHTGSAIILGLTGPPGAGKSTLVGALVERFRRSWRTVAVLAVDPSSPVSGGAALGDRIRIGERVGDRGLFVRSVAARGHRGGLAPGIARMAHVLDAAGFDLIVLETLGVGQGDIGIVDRSHFVIVVQVPGLGDGIQAMKAGLLEIADLVVVNKGDLAGAARVVDELRSSFAMGSEPAPAVLKISATTGDGVDDLVVAIDDHMAAIIENGSMETRRRRLATTEVLDYLQLEFQRDLASAGQRLTDDPSVIDKVRSRDLTPLRAARQVAGR